MCVLFMSYRAVPEFPLVLAMNRDEFFARPTAPAAFWPAGAGVSDDEILAGRDLEAGGTWLGITRHGRFAAISNFRDARVARRHDVRSRGEIVTGFLGGSASPAEFLSELRNRIEDYNDFNLICGRFGEGEEVAYLSSRSRELRKLEPGVYGLSNAFLDTPWPKVVEGKRAFRRAIERRTGLLAESLFNFLKDTCRAPDESLPDTGLGLEGERALSSVFIEPIEFGAKKYGTVSSTAVWVDASGKVYFEQRPAPELHLEPVSYQFKLLKT